MAEWAANLFWGGKKRKQNTKTTTPTSGGEQPVQWETVARFTGLLPAQITAVRLMNDGVPARAWQEGAGQALGLTVGLLGTGHVAVPAEFVEQALKILAIEYAEEEE